jgi:hypothetical protein
MFIGGRRGGCNRLWVQSGGAGLPPLRFLYPFVSLFANFDLAFLPLLLDIPKFSIFRKLLRAGGFSIKTGITKAT